MQSSKRKAIDAFIFVALFLGLGYSIWESGSQFNYNWQWNQVLSFFYEIDEGEFYFGVFYDGLVVTFQVAGTSFVLASLLGLVVMLMSQSSSYVAKGWSLVYVELIRNTPVLIQIYLIYFLLGPTLGWSRMTCGIVALSIFESAYVAEIFRSGVQSVPKGQWEASRSLGLSQFRTYLFVILPQALRLVLPPMTNVLINLVKNSSIVSVIAIADLTTEARNAVADTFLSFEIWFSVALVYLIITILISVSMGFVESLVRIKGT